MMWRNCRSGSFILALVLSVVLTALLPTGGSVSGRNATVPPLQEENIYLPLVARAPAWQLYLGVYFDPSATIGDDLSAFEQLVGKKHGIYHYFTYWGLGDFNVHKFLLDQITGYGATPMITFMSVPAPGNLGCGDTNWNLDSIIGGAHDEYLTTFAQQAARYNHDILLRWGHEMNLDEYSWSGYCNGANLAATQKYVRAYRHIVDIFRQNNADNVHWVWSPNYQSFPGEEWNGVENYYPGDEYVDWIGVVGYNFGKSQSDSGYEWDTFDALFDAFLRDAATLHPTRPLMLADYATTEADGGDKSVWVTDAFEKMRNHPNLKAAIWFDKNPTEYPPPALQFKIDSSQAALDAYRTAIQSADFLSDAPYD